MRQTGTAAVRSWSMNTQCAPAPEAPPPTPAGSAADPVRLGSDHEGVAHVKGVHHEQEDDCIAYMSPMDLPKTNEKARMMEEKVIQTLLTSTCQAPYTHASAMTCHSPAEPCQT